MRFGVPAAASVSVRTRIRRASSILNWLSPEVWRRRVRPRRRDGRRQPGTGAQKDLFRSAGAPRLGGNAAEREPRLPDRALFDPQGSGGRHHGEGVGSAFAEFQIAGMACERAGLGRQPHGDDQIARLEHGFALGRLAGQVVKRLQRHLASSGLAFDLDNGVERDQRHAEIRRVGAMQASLQPSTACNRFSRFGHRTRTRFALVAGAGDVIEISAAGSLQQIAADGRGVAKLCGAPDNSASATAGKDFAKRAS